MDALTFFGSPAATERVPRSLDGGDNYLPDHPSARSTLGTDPFTTFMPIYLAQLRELIGRVLSEHSGQISADGGEQVVSSNDGTLRLDWNRAAVPQIETYFERFHSSAEIAVRGAATAILDGDSNTTVTLYPAYQEQPELERAADQLRLTAKLGVALDARHTLAVYAKTPSRIRFEVRRPRRGRYSEVRVSSPDQVQGSPLDARLLHIIMTVERNDAFRLVQWPNLFRFFDEPDEPGIGDMTRLMTEIFRAANGSDALFHLLLDRLVVDGGISDGVDSRIPSVAIRKLARAGVIENSRLRHRRTPSQFTRYRLTSNYRWLRERVLAGLHNSRPAQTSLE